MTQMLRKGAEVFVLQRVPPLPLPSANCSSNCRKYSSFARLCNFVVTKADLTFDAALFPESRMSLLKQDGVTHFVCDPRKRWLLVVQSLGRPQSFHVVSSQKETFLNTEKSGQGRKLQLSHQQTPGLLGILQLLFAPS